MVRRLPKPRQLTEGRVRDVANRPGAYLLFGTRGAVVYVGSAASLRDRLTHHVEQGDVPARSFVVLPTRTVEQARELERRLIVAHEPRYNLHVT